VLIVPERLCAAKSDREREPVRNTAGAAAAAGISNAGTCKKYSRGGGGGHFECRERVDDR